MDAFLLARQFVALDINGHRQNTFEAHEYLICEKNLE